MGQDNAALGDRRRRRITGCDKEHRWRCGSDLECGGLGDGCPDTRVEGTRKKQRSRTGEDLRQKDQIANHLDKLDDISKGDKQ